jgi:hypothetical protein
VLLLGWPVLPPECHKTLLLLLVVLLWPAVHLAMWGDPHGHLLLICVLLLISTNTPV